VGYYDLRDVLFRLYFLLQICVHFAPLVAESFNIHDFIPVDVSHLEVIFYLHRKGLLLAKKANPGSEAMREDGGSEVKNSTAMDPYLELPG